MLVALCGCKAMTYFHKATFFVQPGNEKLHWSCGTITQFIYTTQSVGSTAAIFAHWLLKTASWSCEEILKVGASPGGRNWEWGSERMVGYQTPSPKPHEDGVAVRVPPPLFPKLWETTLQKNLWWQKWMGGKKVFVLNYLSSSCLLRMWWNYFSAPTQGAAVISIFCVTVVVVYLQIKVCKLALDLWGMTWQRLGLPHIDLGDNDYSASSSLDSLRRRCLWSQFENVRFPLLSVRKSTSVCDCSKEWQILFKCTHFETNPVPFGHLEQPICMRNFIKFSVVGVPLIWSRESSAYFMLDNFWRLSPVFSFWRACREEGEGGARNNELVCVMSHSLALFGRGLVNHKLCQIPFEHFFEPSRGSPMY